MIDLSQKLLFLDGEAMVLDKPAGLAVHGGPATRFSLDDLLDTLRFGFQRRPAPVHRLDRDTSGCLLLARNPKALRRFSAAFEARRVEKTYAAILDGIPAEEQGRIDLALSKISSREAGWRMVPDPAGQAAVTLWRVAAISGARSLLLFTPETGRTHQIRVHAAHGIGIPISGDPVYGGGESGGSPGPMLLHALSLRVPREGKPMIDARAPLPDAFAQAGFSDDSL